MNIITENIKTTEAITENVTLDSLTVTGINPLQENLGLIAKDQTYDVIKRNLGTLPHMALAQETDISLVEYLARPLLIASVDMTVGATINPWVSFLTNPSVAAKLRNVYLIRGNMHLRFIPQADAYTYGVINVVPTIHGHVCDPYASDYGAMIDIGTQKEVELVTPYFGWLPFITLPDVINNSDFTYELRPSVGPKSSQTSTVPTVSVSVYAWITQPDLRIPYAQSGIMKGVNWVNENVPQEAKPTGVLSKPMNAINRAANELGDVPVIGSIAKTAGAIAGAIGRVASWFGFSKPAYLIDSVTTISRYGTNGAAGFGPSYAAKLDHDPKRSKSIDPMTVIGLPHDQLAFGYITRHWGHLTTTSFLSSSAVGAPIFSALCAPGAVNISGNRVDHTPLSSISSLFKFWAGTLEYKFVVVCSTFHKGRIRIYWNPQNPNENPTNTTTMLTLDIAPGNTATMVVPWGSGRPYRYGGLQHFVPTGIENMNNGRILCEVDQKLQVPEPTAPVYVLVFVRAGTDMKFAVPSGDCYSYSKLSPRAPAGYTNLTAFPADSESYSSGEQAFPIVNQSRVDGYGFGVTNRDTAETVDDGLPLEIFGDDFVTLRTLMKRYDEVSIADISPSTNITTVRFRRLPDSVEPDDDQKKNVYLSLLEYVSRSFVLNSGSTRVQAMFGATCTNMSLSRTYGTTAITTPVSLTAPTEYTKMFVAAKRMFAGNVSVRTEPAGPYIEFEIPDMSGLRAQVNDFNYWVEDTCVAVDVIANTQATTTINASIRVLYAAGEDFNFYGYTGPPPMYYWSN